VYVVTKIVLVVALTSSLVAGTLPAVGQSSLERWTQLQEEARQILDRGAASGAEASRARQNSREALRIAKEMGLHPLRVADSLILGTTWIGGEQSVAMLEEALDIRRRELGGETPEVADVLVMLNTRGPGWMDSHAILGEALSIYESALPADDYRIAKTTMLIGLADWKSGDAASAEIRFRKAMALCGDSTETETIAIAQQSGTQLLKLLRSQDRVAEAEALEAELRSVSRIRKALWEENRRQ
jgi:hypothetical protein